MVGQRHVKPDGQHDNQASESQQGPGDGNKDGNGRHWPTARSLLKRTSTDDDTFKDDDDSSDSHDDNHHPHPDMHKKSRNYADQLNKPRQKPGIFRFSDAAKTVNEEQRREYIKKSLIEGIEAEQLNEYRKSKEELKDIKEKKIRRFYEHQNDRLNDWLEVDALVENMSKQVFDSFDPDPDHDGHRERGGALQEGHDDLEALLPEEERKERQKGEKRAKIAINVNVIANIALLAAKIVAAFFSSSLSLIASLTDSALDLLCTIIVWTTNRLVNWRLDSLRTRFPVGRKRLEPLGILVFSIIMVISFLQILQESAKKLLPNGDHELAKLPPAAIFAMVATIVTKGIIWIGCARVKTTQVQALAQDCKTDVYFNTLSLLFPLIGAQANVWWLDPAGAAVLSLFIIYDWAGTCFEQVTRLSGSAVEDQVFSKLVFMCYRFSPIVKGFKTLTAYHAGDGVWVEVDLLLDEKTQLVEAHDVAECLQYCLEGLNEVDRAFVTCDYAEQGPTGHSAAGA